jgi:epoxyqueuosine reductase
VNNYSAWKGIFKTEAFRLGFVLAGFTHPRQPESLPRYQHWLDQNHHAGMNYLARSDAVTKRADPRLLYPPVKTILCLALRYPRPQDASAPAALPAGRVAAYAWGEDYHHVIPALLSRMFERVEQWIGKKIGYKVFTDSAPILERDLAQRAGLGWIGKNGCLIHPKHGSYFLLSEVFLDLEIEPDPPFTADYCGRCKRCILACPTKCILPNRTLDANRCISYLTIENKAAIPLELRPKMGEWVFGCDICQQVCPWNVRFSKPDDSLALSPKLERANFSLISALRLTPPQFSELFSPSPLLRAKRRGFLRNVAVALGNSAFTEGTAILATCLKNETEPLVRAHAAWALGNLGSKEAKVALEMASQSESDPQTLVEIKLALQNLSTCQGNH